MSENIADEISGEIVYKKFLRENGSLYSFYFDNDDGKMVKEWMCNAFSISKVRYNEETADFCYDLTIDSSFGEIKCRVSKGLFTNKRFDELAEKGLNYNNKYIPQIIEYAQYEEQKADHIREFTFIGWKDNKFSGFAEKGKEYVGNIKLSQSDKYDYKTLNKLLKGAYGLQFALTVGCSGCVSGYLSQKIPLTSPIVHFYGDTSLGKTTALQMAVSVWGKPDIDSGMLSTWNQTENCLMSRLCNDFAVPIALDESSICKYDMTSFIYNFSQGVNRQRLMKTGKQAATKQWLCPMVSSGESSILEQCKSNGGLNVRLFEFSLPITKSAKHSNEVKNFVTEKYGHIGKELVSTLEDSEFDDVMDYYITEKNDFLKSIPKDELMPTTDRLSDYYALWVTTAKILNECLEIDVEPDKIKDILLSHHRSLNDNLNTGSKLYNIILDRIVSKRNMYPDKKDYYGQSVEGVVYPDGEVAITRPAFEQILKENGFTNRLTALKELDKNNHLIKQREDTYYSTRTLNRVKTSVVTVNISENYEKILNYERKNDYEIYT